MTNNDSSSEKSKKSRFCRRKKLPDSCTCTSSDDQIKPIEEIKKKEKNKKRKEKETNKKKSPKKEKLRKTKSDETAIRIPSKTTTGTTSGTQYSSVDSEESNTLSL